MSIVLRGNGYNPRMCAFLCYRCQLIVFVASCPPLGETETAPCADSSKQANSLQCIAADASAVASPPSTPSVPTASRQDAGPKDAPLRSLFPDPPKDDPSAPKLKAAIIGAGLAGFSTAVELLDRGYDVEIYDQRPFMGGKVASWQDRDGNHIEMGLHVFFGCYFNLFRLMAKCGVVENLLLKDHAHTFINENGDKRLLDFRFNIGETKVGAPFHGLKAFFTTPQLTALDKAQNALALGTSPVVRALIDPEGGMRDVRKLDNVSFEDWFMSHGAYCCSPVPLLAHIHFYVAVRQ